MEESQNYNLKLYTVQNAMTCFWATGECSFNPEVIANYVFLCDKDIKKRREKVEEEKHNILSQVAADQKCPKHKCAIKQH